MRKVILQDSFDEKWKLDKTTGCWMWTASINRDGYGQIGVNRKNTKAHRVSYELNKGPIPEGQCVCHTCDTPSCVNPDHLFLGTPSENVADMVEKGRLKDNSGRNNPASKLTEAKVLDIRARYAAGDTTQAAIARRFGINASSVGHIVTRHTWRHV